MQLKGFDPWFTVMVILNEAAGCCWYQSGPVSELHLDACEILHVMQKELP